jgi:hypothetical protein
MIITICFDLALVVLGFVLGVVVLSSAIVHASGAALLQVCADGSEWVKLSPEQIRLERLLKAEAPETIPDRERL